MKNITNFISKAFSFISNMPLDKQLHYLHGYRWTMVFFITILLFPALTNTLRIYEIGIIAAILNYIFIGVAKEIFDLRKGGSGFDKVDSFYTGAGGIEAAATLSFLFYVLLWTCRELQF